MIDHEMNSGVACSCVMNDQIKKYINEAEKIAKLCPNDNKVMNNLCKFNSMKPCFA